MATTSDPVDRTTVDRYTAAAMRGDRCSAATIAATVAARSGEDAPAATLVTELFAPSQEAVGEQWLVRQCSVGQEHAATFVTGSVLASLTVGFEPTPFRGTFVMACAEGDRHDLPARMASELLIADGWNVIHLGTATPATELRAYLAGIDADVVGISATVTTSLPGAARSVDVARRLGCTVVVGGRAFGRDATRARAVGADGWAEHLSVGLDLTRICWDDPVEVDLAGRWAGLDAKRDTVVRDAIGWIAVHHDPDVLRSPSWLDAVTRELDQAVGTVVAAMLCDDPSIVAEHREWLALPARSGDAALGPGVYDAIAAVLPLHAPAAVRLVSRTRR